MSGRPTASGQGAKPALCQDCTETAPVARIKRDNGVVWLCGPCVQKAEANFEQHGTIRPVTSAVGETKVFSGESRPALCDHCSEHEPTRRIARTKHRVRWLCDGCAENAKQQFHQVGTIRPRAVGVGGKRSWTPEELEMLVIKMQKPVEQGGLKITKRRFFTKTFDKCFVGSDFVDWCMDNFVCQSRSDASDIGRLLLANNFFAHILDLFTFKDGNLLYRFPAEGDKDEGPPAFEQPLTQLMTKHPVEKGRSVPSLVEACCAYMEAHGLDKEGIYRMSGNKSDIEARRALYNRGRSIIYDRSTDPNEVAGLLKLWIRTMPEPLVPLGSYGAFAEAVKGGGDDESSPGFAASVAALAACVAKLPEYHRFTLARVMHHMRTVAKHEPQNRMTAKNLAMVMGPNIMRQGKAAADDFSALPIAVAVTYRMIVRYDEVFAGVEEEEEKFVISLMEQGQRRDLDPDEILRALVSPTVGCKAVQPAPAGEQGGSVPGDAFVAWMVARYKVSREQAVTTANSIVLTGQLTLVGSSPEDADEFKEDPKAVYRIDRQGSDRPGMRRILSVKTNIGEDE